MDAMTDEEVRRLCGQAWFGHLGLAEDNRAYVIPIFYAFDGTRFYFHAQSGLKDEFFRATEEACFVVDTVQAEDAWMSALIYGRVEEVRDHDERQRAFEALQQVPLPPEWRVRPEEAQESVSMAPEELHVYKLEPRRMSGRKMQPAGEGRHADELVHGGM